MKTYLDCVFCFLKQAAVVAKMTKTNEDTSRKLIMKLADTLMRVPMNTPPPYMGRIGYSLVKKMVHSDDPYKEIKQRSNKLALGIYDELKHKVSRSRDKLLTAVELAIAGNIIDFGVNHFLDIKRELNNILAEEKKYVRKGEFFNYTDFKRSLKEADTILYLADNAGETVFDRILIEQIRRMYPDKEITYVIKEKPIINDALIGDAIICGIDRIAKVISSGSDASGTIVPLCFKSFKEVYKRADMVISKGQGNFESLSRERRPIFFLFMVKCPVVAKDIGCKEKDIILCYNLRKYGSFRN